MTAVSIQLEHLGVLPRLGLKGREVATWLYEQTAELPVNIFDAITYPDGTLVVRLGSNEFMLESSPNGEIVPQLEMRLTPLPNGVFEVPRGDVTLVIRGSDAHLVFAQTCSMDFRSLEYGRVIYTRVAGVSCCILPEASVEPRYRLWVDYGFAPYLWETLTHIAAELGGTFIESKNTALRKALAAH